MAKTAKLGYRWQLRMKMAEHGLFATTDLSPLLAQRGITLSAAQTYRLVTGTPERLSLRTLMALCDILGCTPNDLIEPVAEPARRKATGTSDKTTVTPVRGRRPRRAEVHRSE